MLSEKKKQGMKAAEEQLFLYAHSILPASSLDQS